MHHILFFTIYCYAQQEKKIIQKEVNGSSVPITIKEFVIWHSGSLNIGKIKEYFLSAQILDSSIQVYPGNIKLFYRKITSNHSFTIIVKLFNRKLRPYPFYFLKIIKHRLSVSTNRSLYDLTTMCCWNIVRYT
jgi:hypothetical protein